MYNACLLVAGYCMLALWFSDKPTDLDHAIADTAESIIESRYQTGNTDIDVRIIRTGGTIIADGALDIVLPEQSRIPRANIRVDIYSGPPNEDRQVGWAILFVAHYDSVMVANRAFRQEDQIPDDNLVSVWTETTRFHGEPLTPDALQAIRLEGEIFARRHLTAHRLLRIQDIRNAYAIKTGESVNMLYNHRGVLLELTCKARKHGFAGEVVKMFSTDTKLMYKARITGQGTAVWLETLE